MEDLESVEIMVIDKLGKHPVFGVNVGVEEKKLWS